MPLSKLQKYTKHQRQIVKASPEQSKANFGSSEDTLQALNVLASCNTFDDIKRYAQKNRKFMKKPSSMIFNDTFVKQSRNQLKNNKENLPTVKPQEQITDKIPVDFKKVESQKPVTEFKQKISFQKVESKMSYYEVVQDYEEMNSEEILEESTVLSQNNFPKSYRGQQFKFINKPNQRSNSSHVYSRIQRKNQMLLLNASEQVQSQCGLENTLTFQSVQSTGLEKIASTKGEVLLEQFSANSKYQGRISYEDLGLIFYQLRIFIAYPKNYNNVKFLENEQLRLYLKEKELLIQIWNLVQPQYIDRKQFKRVDCKCVKPILMLIMNHRMQLNECVYQIAQLVSSYSDIVHKSFMSVDHKFYIAPEQRWSISEIITKLRDIKQTNKLYLHQLEMKKLKRIQKLSLHQQQQSASTLNQTIEKDQKDQQADLKKQTTQHYNSTQGSSSTNVAVTDNNLHSKTQNKIERFSFFSFIKSVKSKKQQC